MAEELDALIAERDVLRAALAVAEAMNRAMECRAAACRPGTSDEQKRALEDKAVQHESAAFRALDRYRTLLDVVQGKEEDASQAGRAGPSSRRRKDGRRGV